MSIYVVLLLKIFNKYSVKSLKMTLDGKSIRTVARKRECIAPTFSTPPGSPFQGLLPYGRPMAEPSRRRGEKFKILAAGHYQKFYAKFGLNLNI